MKLPAVSVIVPVYNTEPYLCRCVDSLLAQTYRDFEVILVDDGSTDSSGAICDEYAAKNNFIHVLHLESGGVAAARNAGLDWVFNNSDSEYIGFVDSDDCVHPLYLELLMKAAEEYGTLISACDYQRFSREEELADLPKEIETTVEDPELVLTRGEKKLYSYVWGMLYQKALWKEIRFPVGRVWEDTATTYKLLFSVPRVAVISAPLYYYFTNTEGITQSRFSPEKLDHIWAMEEMLSDPIVIGRKSFNTAAQYNYLAIIASQIDELNSIDWIDMREKRTYLKPLQKKLRRGIRAFQGEIDKSRINWMVQNAYPVRTWVFWTVKGIWNKVREVLSCQK